MAAEEGEREREKGRASVMIRRCFNDSAFLWQRACRGWPPRRPASVSSGGGECIERPAAILVDTQPRFSGMNFSVCARACIYPCHSRALPVLLSTLPFLLPDAHTRDRPLLSSRTQGRTVPSILSGSYIYHFHLCLCLSIALGHTAKPVTTQCYLSFEFATRRFRILTIPTLIVHLFFRKIFPVQQNLNMYL